MDLKQISGIIEDNLSEIERLETEIKKVAPEIPQLSGYTEDDFILYLAEQEIYPSDSDYTTYKNHLIEKNQKRQEFLTSRNYYITLNAILENMIDFYLKYLRDPTSDELETLSEGTGVKENINQAITYIEDNLL